MAAVPRDVDHRIVVLSNLVPYDAVPHAGGQYMRRLLAEASHFGEVTLVVPNTAAARDAATQPGAPQRLLIGGQGSGRSIVDRGLRWVASHMDRRLRQRDQGLPPVDLALALLRDPRVRGAIAAADVLDLQWSEMIRLAPVLRRINPRARVVGTFHDVQSQLFAREVTAFPEDAAYWTAQAARARRLEERSVRRLDAALAFSAKDLQLLGDPVNGAVIRPPLAGAGGSHRAEDAVAPPTVLFVSHLARPENADAVRWLLADVWPAVRDAVPEARLRLVGAGADPSVVGLVDSVAGACLTGFVDDLGSEYAGARVVVVPLRFGAGVKFKTIDALLAGVPVVATTVGAEGVGPDDLFVRVTDDPAAFAQAVIDVLEEPRTALGRSLEAKRWAEHTFGLGAFRDRLAEVYGLASG